MIELTPKAQSEIKRLKESETDQASKLRVKVIGGGCSGMSYQLGFDADDVPQKDKVFEFEGFEVVVDPKSYLFLKGLTLDYTDGLNGRGFVFNNPNAKRTCGCGSSFSA